MAFPSVASVHLMIIVTNYQGTSRELFTSNNPNVICAAVAIEAPLTICAAFMTLSVVLIAVSGLAGHRRRCSCVFAGALVAFLSDVVLYLPTFGIDTSVSNLSRPFLFNMPWTMLTVVLFITLSSRP